MVLPVSDCEWTELTPGSPPSLSHSLLLGAYDFRHSSGSLAIFTAILRVRPPTSNRLFGVSSVSALGVNTI
jgi:hypothetical protein